MHRELVEEVDVGQPYPPPQDKGFFDTFQFKSATVIISLIDILIFGFTVIHMVYLLKYVESEDDEDLYNYSCVLYYWGAKHTPSIVYRFQFWRLLTAALLHGGFGHLFGNLIVQVYYGVIWENQLGWKKTYLVYTIGALVASLFSCVAFVYETSVGASGAIFAFCGLELSYFIINFPALSTKRTAVFVILAPLLFMSFIDSPENVDIAGHSGGLFAGLIMGFILYFRQQQKSHLEYTMTAILAFVIFVLFVIIFSMDMEEDLICQNMKLSEIESKFNLDRHQENLKELDAFICLTLVVIAGKVIVALQSKDNLFTSVCVLGFGLFLFSRYLIRNRPNMLQYLLIAVQIILCIAYNYNSIVPNNNVIVVDCYIRWYLGFEAATIHTCKQIYNQIRIYKGVISSNSLNYIVYISVGEYESIQKWIIQINFILLLIGIVLMRYRFEYYKRTQYLDLLQNTKWITIIDKLVKQQIVILSSSDQQIRVKQCNTAFQKLMRIEKEADVSKLIRCLEIKQTKQTKQTLEQFLLKFEFTNDIDRICIQTLIHKDTDIHYTARFMSYHSKDEQQIIFSIEEFNTNKYIQHLKQQKQSNLILLKQFCEEIVKKQNLTKYRQQDRYAFTKEFWTLSHTLNMLTWLKPFKVQTQLINSATFSKMINKILPQQTKFKNQIKLISDASHIQRIILNLIYLMRSLLKVGQYQISLLVEQISSDSVQITMITDSLREIDQTIIEYLESKIYFENYAREHIQYYKTNHELLERQLNKVRSILQPELLQNISFAMVILKYLLIFYGRTNQVFYNQQAGIHEFRLVLVSLEVHQSNDSSMSFCRQSEFNKLINNSQIIQ